VIKGIEHVAIASFNPHELAEWYVRQLDCIKVADTVKTVYLRAANGAVIEFVYADNLPPTPEIRDAGLRHIAFAVDDLDEASSLLISRGISFVDERVEMAGLRLRFFQDPEGNFLHLVQREVPLPNPL
jgi:glyoxylase I family protein